MSDDESPPHSPRHGARGQAGDGVSHGGSHICESMCVLPRRSSEGTLVPLHAQSERSLLGWGEPGFPLQVELLNALSLDSSTQHPPIDLPLGQLLLRKDGPSSPSTPTTVLAVALSSTAERGGPGRAPAQLRVPWLGRLAVEARLQQLALEVQDRISSRLGALQEEVRRRSEEVRRAETESERMKEEKQRAEERANELARQVDVSVEMLANLRQELMDREAELHMKHQEVCDLDRFVCDTVLREARAKVRLQAFIEDLLERAEVAEQQLHTLHTHFASQNTHTALTSPSGSSTGTKLTTYQRSYSVSGMSRHQCQQYHQHAFPHGRCPGGRQRTLSVGSGGLESDFEGVSTPLGAQYHVLCKGGRGGPAWTPESPRLGPQTLASVEADSDSWSLYTAESPQEDWNREDRHTPSPGLGWTYRVRDRSAFNWQSCHSKGRSCKADESMVCVERLRTRAGLFCVFSYLDTHTLLTAAEVCMDWRSVARHPAVWTRVTLENTRVSSKFLTTLSQWCVQTQSLVLKNLKPRPRGKKESREDFVKSTRGCLEAGLEAVLKSAGRSLTFLRVSHCPNILTDRSLWLVSCYCRALRSLIYRSSSDPVGQEVIWALGAGCRDISSLYIAPLQPCQQPSRFSNRCLQTIGRCWPNLRKVGVGGTACGIQGLVSLVRNCVCLWELELTHMSGFGQEEAAELCREGLQELSALTFTSTPVTPKALLHFHSMCGKLRSIVVQISIGDYFEDAESVEAKKLFQEKVKDLQALRERPGLSVVLHLRVDGLQ